MMEKKPLFQGSLAVAEASRDRTPYSGLLAGLFEGIVRRNLFRSQSIPPVSETAKDFLEHLRLLLIKKVDPESIDQEGEVGEDVLAALKDIGAFGLKIPATYGGLGLSQSDYHRVATLLGSHDAATTVLISAHNSIGVAEPVKLIGNREQQQRLLPRLARGDISGFALTEKGAGCDIWDLRTYAVPVREHDTLVGYRLTGEKLYTTNAPRQDDEFLASLLVVIAQIVSDPEEVSRPKSERRFGAFVVDTRTPGCHCTRLRYMGVRGIYNGAVRFDNVFVPLINRLGEEGEGLRRALESLTIGRLTLPAACLGSLKQCLWLARSRAQQRVQYDRPIGEHTDIGAKIVRMASRVLALEALVTITGIWADRKVDVRLESAAAKVLATEWLLDSVLDLFRIYSGRGFETSESLRLHGDLPAPIERLVRDALINVIWEGTNGILTLWIGREGLAEYVSQGKAFLELQISEMVRAVPFFAKVAGRALNRFPRFTAWPASATPESTWERFVTNKSRDLALKSLWAAAHHRQGLARKQLLTTQLVKAGMQLFAVEALVWYASQHAIRNHQLTDGLLEHFCSQVKEAFHPTPLLALRQPPWQNDSQVFHLAKDILAGKAEWLEDGIIAWHPTEQRQNDPFVSAMGEQLAEMPGKL
ncbi:MAG: acyl-CoA dehydrogenase family protein [Nitrospirae bacterium]|nr:acyl-CoA dehydrogenase family protein [Nitrospirota bacterium]